MRPIDWLAVTALLLFAAGLRMIGISYGQLNPDYFPSTAPLGMVHEQAPIQPDEFFNVAIPVNMALRNRLNPEFFNYPALIINTNFVLLHLTGALEGLSLADRDGFSLRAYAAFPIVCHVPNVFGIRRLADGCLRLCDFPGWPPGDTRLCAPGCWSQ